ncbi:hypothetical protein RND81_10G079600 [Saponaria officinalis]|uniref:Seven-in-absentia protein TRAF-like domain-containing protein n=1 Tax=Saponaria officinalis TaxID=3572 RepID=A0AAW1I0B2_SAPOF
MEVPEVIDPPTSDAITDVLGKTIDPAQCVFNPNLPNKCLFAGSNCTFMGDIPNLVAHLIDDHRVDSCDGTTLNGRFVELKLKEVENAANMLMLYSCFGQHFCLQIEPLKLGKAPSYIAFLRFMGDDNEAKTFNYSLELRGNERTIVWEGVPRSIHRKARDNFDGLIIERNMARFLSGGDRKESKLRVRIWKE